MAGLNPNGVTVKANLKRPEVLQALLESDIEMRLIHAKLRFKELAIIDDTLVGQPGDKINVVAYNYIGDASVVGEGEEISIEQLTGTEKVSPEIRKTGKGVQITDEAILTAYGNPVGEAKAQIELAIRDKFDKDIMAELDKAVLVQDGSTEVINYQSIVKGVGKFQDEEEGTYLLYIHPDQKVDLVADKMFEYAHNLKDSMLVEGALGKIGGCYVLVSRRVPRNAGVYTNYICKREAVKVLTKRGVQVEVDRNIRTQSNDIVATTHYVCWLQFGDRVVKLKTKAGFVTETPVKWDAPTIGVEEGVTP